MPRKFKRTTVFHVNKFQKALFYPVICAFFIGCFISWLSIIYFFIGECLFHPELYRFKDIIPGLLSLATVLMIIIIFWTFRISSRYFGSYERIIKELDQVLAGEEKGPLQTRHGDVIFEGLLRRINILIEKTRQL